MTGIAILASVPLSMLAYISVSGALSYYRIGLEIERLRQLEQFQRWGM